jgi:hypothetical protein
MPLPSRNWSPSSGRWRCSGTAKKQRTITPKPEGEFWQAAHGDGDHPPRPHPRAATPGAGHAPGRRPTRVCDAASGGAVLRRPVPGERTPAEALAGCGSGASRSRVRPMRGPWVKWRPGEGAGTHISASLYLLSPWRRGRTSDSARGRSLLPLALGSGIGGTGPASGSPRDRTTGRDRRSPPPTQPEPKGHVAHAPSVVGLPELSPFGTKTRLRAGPASVSQDQRKSGCGAD